MRDQVELRYGIRRVLRRIKRGALEFLSANLVAWKVFPPRGRIGLLRRIGIDIDSTVKISKGVRFENRNVRIGAGATIGEGVRFEGAGAIDVAAGAVVPSGHVLSTRVETELDGLFIDRPILWTKN